MAIHDQRYRPWEGKPRARAFVILTIALENARVAFSTRWVRWLLYLCFLVIAGYTFGFFITTLFPETFRINRVLPAFSSNNVYRRYLVGADTVLLFAVIAAAAGAGLIARDLRAHAALLYLSRPVGKGDYLLGKAMALGIFLLSSTLLPAFVLWISALAIGNEELDFGSRLLDLAGITATSLLVVVPMTLGVLACSSLTRRPALAGVYWILFFLGTMIFGETLARYTEEDLYSLISIPNNLWLVAEPLFKTRLEWTPIRRDYGVLPPLFALLGLVGVSSGVLFWRFRRFEEA